MALKDTITKPEVGFFLSIVIPIIGVAIGWGIFSTRVNYLETAVAELKKDCDGTSVTLIEIKVQLAEISKDILYIKEKIQ